MALWSKAGEKLCTSVKWEEYCIKFNIGKGKEPTADKVHQIMRFNKHTKEAQDAGMKHLHQQIQNWKLADEKKKATKEAIKNQDLPMEEDLKWDKCSWGKQELIPQFLFCNKDYNLEFRRSIYTGNDCLVFTLGNMCEWNMIKSKQELDNISNLFQHHDPATEYSAFMKTQIGNPMGPAKYPMIVEFKDGRWVWYRLVLQDYLDYQTMLLFAAFPEIIDETLTLRNMTQNILMITTQKEDNGTFANHAYNCQLRDGEWCRKDLSEPIWRICNNWEDTSPYLWFATTDAYFLHLEVAAITVSCFQKVNGVSVYQLLMAKNPDKKEQIEEELANLAKEQGKASLFYQKATNVAKDEAGKNRQSSYTARFEHITIDMPMQAETATQAVKNMLNKAYKADRSRRAQLGGKVSKTPSNTGILAKNIMSSSRSRSRSSTAQKAFSFQQYPCTVKYDPNDGNNTEGFESD